MSQLPTPTPISRPRRGQTKGLVRRAAGNGRHGSDRELNRSVARALEALLAIARSDRPLSFVDLQRRQNVPKATLHKLLSTLEALNFVRRDPETAKYSVGLTAHEVSASSSTRPGDLRSVLDPMLHKLVEEWNETLHLCVYDEGEEIILDRLDPAFQMVRLATGIGRRHPAYATSGGLAALAILPEDVALKGLPAKLRTMTVNTVKTRKELQARLRKVREMGYAVDMEEAYIGVRCVGIAVPVPGWPLVTVSFSLPLQRGDEGRMHALAKPLLVAASEIERALIAARPQ